MPKKAWPLTASGTDDGSACCGGGWGTTSGIRESAFIKLSDALLCVIDHIRSPFGLRLVVVLSLIPVLIAVLIIDGLLDFVVKST
mgnify:CR=1 FL=1